VIIGGGFGGVGAAIELQAHGFRNLTLIDRASELGGTWFHNTYPGAACDVPSHLYSYSYAQRRDWTRLCSPQSEILSYIQGVAHTYGVDRIAELGVEISDVSWNDGDRRWSVRAEDGREWDADAVVIATGQLHRPSLPRIEGAGDFQGRTFHSAEWDHDYDLAGKRVAVVGTGASAVQFVPEIAKTVGHLDVFQRSGNWFLPRNSRPYPTPLRWAFAHVPGLQAFRRWFIYHYGNSLTAMIRHPRTLGLLGKLRSVLFMRRQLRDPGVREKVWPDYTFGCKRVLFSSHWLPALQRPNVEVHTEAITRVEAGGVRTADGTLHEADCIIWGTGFKTTSFMLPMEIHGREGRSISDTWAQGAHAHLGVTVPGYPSLFFMYGPNTNTSGGSIIVYLEAQAAYIRQALQMARDADADAIEVRAEAEQAIDAEIQARFAGTAWLECDSWYRDEGGRIVTNWPGYMGEYVEATGSLDPADFELIRSAV
jgi:cation diffusion facilitator CzcD-associated flavoprotein CzcO